MLFKSKIVNQFTLALLGFAGLGVNIAAGQGLTISARPGLVNYFEGVTLLNGNALVPGAKVPSFVDPGASLSTQKGKAEILLMPGAFLRIGNNSQIVMQSDSLVTPRFELVQGEAMVEVVGLLHGSQIEVVDGNALVVLEKDGLYRLTAAASTLPTAAVIEGSAQVTLLGKSIKLGKGRQTVLVGSLESQKFDLTQDDELYAWSSVRSQYIAAASYDAATLLAGGDQAATVGWYFDSLLDCWAWLPNGLFFSPFGWGFYSPVLVGGATVIRCPVVRGGHWHHPKKPGDPNGGGGRQWVGMGTTRPVAINPKHPPALQQVNGSPASNQIARAHEHIAKSSTNAVSETHVAHNNSAAGNRNASNTSAEKTHTVKTAGAASTSHGSTLVHTASASHAGTSGGGHVGGGGGGGGGAHAGGGGGGGHAGGGGGGHH